MYGLISEDIWQLYQPFLPIDILDAKRLPIIGWLDDGETLAVFVLKMSKYITPEMEGRADDQLDKWFSEYTEYEMNEG